MVVLGGKLQCMPIMPVARCPALQCNEEQALDPMGCRCVAIPSCTAKGGWWRLADRFVCGAERASGFFFPF
jgi:hypothetical protein